MLNRFFKLLILLIFFLIGCSENPTDSPVILQDETSFKIRDYVIQRTVEGQMNWLLQAETGDYYENQKKIEMEDITVNFYNDNEHIATLTGDTGTIDTEKNDMIVRGNVIYTRLKDNLRMETEIINWDDEKDIFYNHSDVVIKDGSREIRSIGITANRDLTEYGLENVQAEGVDETDENK